MSFSSVEIKHVRNLHAVSLELSQGMNWVVGPNGSGKTSFFEALYVLIYGKSFRLAKIDYLMMHETDAFSIQAQVMQQAQDQVLRLKKVRGQSGQYFVNQVLAKRLPIAQRHPLVFINTDAHRIFFSTPSRRRQLIDWGLFHVNPEFYGLWQKYQRVWQQRNRLLKANAAASQLAPWSGQLVELGE